MKKTHNFLRIFIAISFLVFAMPSANGQFFKKLKKRAEKSAERTVERRVETETSKKTDQVLDSILEPGKGKQPGDKEGNPVPPGQNPGDSPNTSEQGGNEPMADDGAPQSIKVYSKFDFVPGDKQLFFDDFSNDFVGDFPARWNTNAGGELVVINNSTNKWLKILPGYGTAYIPDLTDLPEDFTLEFDVVADGLTNQTSSQAFINIIVGDNNNFESAKNYAMVEYSFCQFIAQGFTIENRINGKREIRNNVQADVRNIIKDPHHVSIAVNKQRFRVWINEKKYVDVPRLLPANVGMKSVKFHLRGIDINKEAIYLSNVKIAEGGVDLRRKLLAEGRISTNAILFDSGSANLQPQSMGVIRQISQVLQQDPNISLNIIGHTDSDGNDSANLELSKKRAEAVKNALTSIYNVSEERLTYEGKGETEPVGDNGTVDGKAQNRRVEFVKI